MTTQHPTLKNSTVSSHPRSRVVALPLLCPFEGGLEGGGGLKGEVEGKRWDSFNTKGVRREASPDCRSTKGARRGFNELFVFFFFLKKKNSSSLEVPPPLLEQGVFAAEYSVWGAFSRCPGPLRAPTR